MKLTVKTILAILFIALTIISCSKSNDNNSNGGSSDYWLVGTWGEPYSKANNTPKSNWTPLVFTETSISYTVDGNGDYTGELPDSYKQQGYTVWRVTKTSDMFEVQFSYDSNPSISNSDRYDKIDDTRMEVFVNSDPNIGYLHNYVRQ